MSDFDKDNDRESSDSRGPQASSFENVPGTVHLLDLAGTLNVQKVQDGDQNIILQPQPSEDVNDPLRWSKRKKNLQFVLLWVWSVFLAITVNWGGPYWGEWQEDFGVTASRLNVCQALNFLFLGVGCVVLQPTAMKVGRRVIYLFCTALAVVGNAMAIHADSVDYIMASMSICGFAAAPTNSLVEISSTDVFFVHERASKLSWLVFAIYFGSYIGPVVAAYLPNWQWAFKLQVIILCVLFVVQLFLMEDTSFVRDEKETEREILHQIKSRETGMSPEHSGSGKAHHIISQEPTGEADSYSDPSTVKRSYIKRMQLLELEYNDKRPFWKIFTKPIYTACFPAVFWSGIVYGAQMMWLSLLTTTQSELYTTYYGFSTSSTGLTNLAALGGSLVGMVYGGPFVDWLTVKLAHKNNGILEPEFRLWAMIGPTLFNAGGLLAYCMAPLNGEAWAVSVIVGQGFLGFAMAAAGPICLTYAIDCYTEAASESLVFILFLRNMIGCGFTFAIQPWLDRCGLATTTWLMFMLSVVINGSFLVFIVFGKAIRRKTRHLYEKITAME
ncbi:hypothetical protein FT663_05402 [Candidozyma haemuli var. vulneris]|uniref:Major facilitator superfamily (MFS) profile domain-containing protein n=1 Tax=Candidozyma haemuli TaxID=45357 RepID=A0A2V1AMA7_9ASCO|nr:hypothetical protein CXQ85_001104 [[Candida] haemuloni]KAF3985173.1 hypothetical protein FT663_05402 [[Candida] haemuloni var. vulneris]KAF3994135.1 hypothetical protein FT662_00004 [[Candida] haemuloni var. vulneris]PVH18814.1 hypothetical protein CXQ85_001104 [[Candida] haemuloni]